jgi:RNA polymerase sigma-70 factor (ECF subfamily)
MTVLTADDARLVARLRHGDAGAARELYERHCGTLLRFGLAMSNCRQTAEDVVHDTFVELLRHPSRFDPARGPVIAFLLGIARHRMARIARVSGRDSDDGRETLAGAHEGFGDDGEAPPAASTAGVPSGIEDAADALDRAQSIERVRAAVFDLPRVHREVIALCDLEELPYATVAAILDCPVGTVRSRLSRARALLATRLDVSDEAEDDEDADASSLTLSVRGSLT